MKYKNQMQRTLALLILLLAGWAVPGTVSARSATGSPARASAPARVTAEYAPLVAGQTYRAYFDNSETYWSQVYVYMWDGETGYELFGGWNGMEVKDTEIINGKEYYVLTFTAESDFSSPMIIFNSGGEYAEQTKDLQFYDGGAYAAYSGLTDIFENQDQNQVKAPVFSKKSGDFYEDFSLTITDPNEPAGTIYYTLNGTEPSATNGNVYASPIMIPAGMDVTVKAVVVTDNGTSNVTTAKYHFLAKHPLNFKFSNKGGISYVYYSTNSEYGNIQGEKTVYITDGTEVYLEIGVNSGYEFKNVTVNGNVVSTDRYFGFVMPASAADLVINVEYNPESPSDPQPGDTTKKYKLTLVSNPVGSCYLYGEGEYPAGTITSIQASQKNSYEFVNWTLDGEEISGSYRDNFTMPAQDVVLTANFRYNPADPTDPDQPKLLHPLTATAFPPGAGYFYTSATEVPFGDSYNVQAWANEGYKFKGWLVNGVAQEETSNYLYGIMTDAGAQVVGLFVYDPSSPSNPNANYYNPTTGQLIMDDFEPGYLYQAIRNVLNGTDKSNVSSIIVKGKINSSDIGAVRDLSNAATMDLSRVGGVTTIPGYSFQNTSVSSVLLSSAITNLDSYVFNGCSNLASLTVYALEPPVCSNYTFSGFTNKDNCTVFVPKEAIELYSNAEYWKDFTIMPITNDVHVLQVNLPADAADGRYKHNSLEIVNVNSGIRQKYVVSDRLLYTFNGLQKDEQYNVYMLSQAGLEIGRIENVTIPDHDLEVTFDNMKTLHSVFAKVVDAEGNDVTEQTTVEWLKPLADGTITYLRKAVSLGEIPDGQKLICRVTLGDKLGAAYATPEDVEFTVSDTDNTCEISLVPFRTIELTGKVVDGDNAPLAGASVSAVQTLNGKYNKTFTAKTDRDGLWRMNVLDAPETRMTYAAIECVNVNETVGAFEAAANTVDLGTKTLRSIVGARVNYGFTYKAADAEEVQNTYADYQNVAVSVYNVTQDREHPEVSMQYPVLAVLDENINTGDELRLTATSKTGAFNPIIKTVIVGEDQRAEVTFDIIGKGGISASFEMTENPAVTAMLYGSNGELVKKQAYTEAKTLFSELADGDYTLVTMGQSDLMNSILRLANFAEIGLTEGKDYVKNAVTVETGKLTEVKNPEIPAFDESLFYYTNDNTGFSSNKSSISTGGYLTLRANIGFKGAYKDGISNVALVVDLPEACDFVEQSVVQGPNLLPYTLDNRRLTVQLGDKYNAQTRFCVIPTAGGFFNATASIVFDYNGRTLTQPIGSSISEIKDIEISVPSVIAGTAFKVSGIAPGNSNIEVYEEETMLGSGKANSAGSWNVECELKDPRNLSIHSIYAKITTPAGNTLTTESKSMTYDINALQVSKVTMYHWNPELNGWKGGMEISEFDFQNPKTTPTQWTVYYPQKKFTYTIEFTDNDPERISNVVLYVHTADGKYVPVNASFDSNKGMWYAEIDMGTSSDGYYPVNCSVDFDYVSEKVIDVSEIDQTYENLSAEYDDYVGKLQLLDNYFSGDKHLDYSEFYELTDSLGIATLIEPDEDADLLPSDFDTWTQDQQDAYIDDELNNVISGNDELLNSLSYLETAFKFEKEFNIELEDVKFKVTSYDGTSVESLIADGFVETTTTSGNKVYSKITEDTVICVDPENGLYIESQILQESGDMSGYYAEESQTGWQKYSACMKAVKRIMDVINLKWTELQKLAQFPEEKLDEAIQLIQNRLRNVTNWKNNSKVSLVKRLKWAIEEDRLAHALAGVKLAKRICKPLVKRLLKAVPFAGYIATLNDCYHKSEKLWILYYSIPDPCPDDAEDAQLCRNWCYSLWTSITLVATVDVIGSFSSDAAIVGGVISSFATAGTSLMATLGGAVGKAIIAIGGIIADMTIDHSMTKLSSEISSLKCYREKQCGDEGMPPCGGGGGGKGPGSNGSGSPDDGVIIDPSGFVYEAVPENRVEGVQATIYYKEIKENMYGDPYEEIMLWNAEEYAQSNPLFTDENGMYRWDVPQGLWQVKFEKDGYVTAYSEWLPVPPPQLDVNIGIVQNKQPEVTEARAYEEGIEVKFDKFMDISTLTTDNIYVTANGEKLLGEIRMVDEALADEYATDEDTEAVRYASRVRFVPEQALSTTTGEVRLTVSRNVLSYAGIPMTETYTQVLDVEKEVQTIYADDVKVLYGGAKEVTVFAVPFDAAAGRTLRIANSSDLIATVDTNEAVLDAEGKAVVRVTGGIPGRTQLNFTIDDVTATGSCAVDVVTEIITAEAPTASRASGTAVYRGTKVELKTDSKDATIWFTTDGSCPCDAEGTRRKYTVPIVINEDTKIIAMTAVGTDERDVSETVEFNYTVKRSDMDIQMPEGWTWISHNFDNPVAASTVFADSNVTRMLSQTAEVIRDPQLGLVGNLTEMTAPESYKVETSAETARQRLSDIAWNPATPISLTAGWNWLGYPAAQTMTVDEALATTECETLDMIVGQNGFAQFDGEKWVGTLETMSPGMGYMYQSQSEKKVVYNTNIVSNASATHAPGIADNSTLAVDIHKYPAIMPVVATLQGTDCSPLDNEEYQVAAFSGTECRGVGRVVEGKVMINVYGNVNDPITLSVTDAAGETRFETEAALDLDEKGVGDIFDPYVVTINNGSGIADVTYSGDITVTVDNDMLRIRGIAAEDIELVEVYDIDGRKLVRETNVPESGIRVSGLVYGTYVVIVKGNGEYTYHKVAVR